MRIIHLGWAIGLLLAACSESSTSDPDDSSNGGTQNGGNAGNTTAAGASNAGTGGSGGVGGSAAGGLSGSGGDTHADGGTSPGGTAGSDAAAGSGGQPPSTMPDAGEPPPDLPAGYTLQLEETFASAAALDRMVFANPNDWSYAATSGGYLQSTGFTYNNPQYYSPHSIAVLKERKFGSFVLEVELLQTSMTGGHRDFAIFWGMQGPNQYYYAHIGQAHDGASHNIHIVNNSDRTAITDTFTDGFDWGDVAEWHKFRLVRDISTGVMELYGDDAPDPILTANDTTLGEGYIGFGSFDDTGGVRNVKIWALSSSAQVAAFFESAL